MNNQFLAALADIVPVQPIPNGPLAPAGPTAPPTPAPPTPAPPLGGPKTHLTLCAMPQGSTDESLRRCVKWSLDPNDVPANPCFTVTAETSNQARQNVCVFQE